MSQANRSGAGAGTGAASARTNTGSGSVSSFKSNSSAFRRNDQSANSFSSPPANGASGRRKSGGGQAAGAAAPGSSWASQARQQSQNDAGSKKSAEQAAAPVDPHANGHMLDRQLFLLGKAVGCRAVVTCASGDIFEGVFAAASVREAEFGVVLDMATNRASKEFAKQVVIPSKELMSLQVVRPDMTPDQVDSSDVHHERAAAGATHKFRTDTDISSAGDELRERELQRWVPDAPEANAKAFDMSDAATGSSWDQFAVNQSKFGVKSTYDEHYYTTAIDKSHPEYLEREKRAEKIASEINASATGGSLHVAEERGLAVDDSGLDEEDKYSGVQRKSSPLKLPQKPVTAANSPASSGPSSSSQTPTFLPPKARSPGPQKSVGLPTKPSQNSSGRTLNKPVLRSAGSSSSNVATPGANSSIPNKPGALPNDPAIIAGGVGGTIQQLPPTAARSSSKYIEKDLVANLQKFVSGENEKLHQKRTAMQRKGMVDQLHEFRAFSAGYKISAPVPPDLIPLLAKDKEKQEEILQRTSATTTSANSAASSPEARHVNPVKAAAEPAASATTKTSPKNGEAATAAATAPAPESKPKAKRFNFKAAAKTASEFKPFTPSPMVSAPSFSPKPVSSPIVPQPVPTPLQQQQHLMAPQAQGYLFVEDGYTFTDAAEKKATRAKQFNPFLRQKAEFDSASHPEHAVFTIEKTFTTPPTWPSVREGSSYLEQFDFDTGMINMGGAAGGFSSHVPMVAAVPFDPQIMANPAMAPRQGYYPYAPQYVPQYQFRAVPGQFNSPIMGQQFIVQQPVQQQRYPRDGYYRQDQEK